MDKNKIVDEVSNKLAEKYFDRLKAAGTDRNKVSKLLDEIKADGKKMIEAKVNETLQS